MTEVPITPQELQSRRITDEHLATALRAMREDGFVILGDVADMRHIAAIRDRMREDLGTLMARTGKCEGNGMQTPPLHKDFIFRDILLNDMVSAVLLELLGPNAYVGMYESNTNLPGSKGQPVHADLGQLWPNMTTAHPVHSIAVNFPLVDMDHRNGATEVWPGTHVHTGTWHSAGRFPSDDLIAAQRKVCEPIQIRARAGSAVLRDMRMWHRGVPNPSSEPRIMISMIYQCAWMRGGPFKLPKECQDVLKDGPIKVEAVYVDEPIDYLGLGAAR